MLNMMRGMSYMPVLGLGRRQHEPREFTFTVDHDIPYGLGYTPTEEDAHYMARLRKDRVKARLSKVPFDYPICLYTFQLTDYFVRGSDHAPHMEGITCISEAVEIQDLQQTLGQMHLGTGILKTPDVMIVAPPLPNRASMSSVCFLEAVSNYDILMDTVIDADGVTLPDACTDEMDMIGVGHILDAVPHGPHSDFDLFRVSVIDANDVNLYDACTNKMDMIGTSRILDATPHGPHSGSNMFGVFMLEKDDDDSVTIITPDVITIEGASDFVDPPLSFDSMSGFVTCFDDVAGGNNNDMSVF